MSLKIFLLNW